MTFNVLTAFPNFYTSFFETSLIKKAIESKVLNFNIIDFKDFGLGKFKKIDDTPYGGGPGMVIRVDIVDKALNTLDNKGYTVLLAPSGKRLTQSKVQELAKHENITLICGRYEGFDYRVTSLVDEVISVGDFITMGGEAPSLILIESISRLKKDVIGDIQSTVEESHSDKYESEPPIYTRPEVYKDLSVPKVLLSGNHKEIEVWKNKNGKLRNT